MTEPPQPALSELTGRPDIAHPVSVRTERLQLVLADFLMAACGTLIGLTVRFGEVPATRLSGAVLLPVVWVIAIAWGGAYDPRLLAAGFDEYRRVLNTAVWLGLVIAIGSFAVHLDLSRSFVALTLPLATLLTLLGRRAMRGRLRTRLSTGYALHRVVMVGTRASVERLTAHMERNRSTGYRVVAAIDGLPHAGSDDVGVREIQTARLIDGLIQRVHQLGADAIAVTSSEALGPGGIRRLSWELEGTGVELMLAPNLTDVAGPRIGVRLVAGLPLLHIDEPSFTGGQRAVKECMDRTGALALLVLLGPVLALIALAALVSQGRPILFRQQRVGREGRTFTMHKFRTMRNGAHEERARLTHLNQHDGHLFKVREDPRVTPFGRVLRRHSLDELPQLWDVLRGSMSLVGPRPPLPAEVELYGDVALRRLLVKPGMTGLWQVSGRSELAWDETLRLDLHYVENWSVGFDVLLLCRTVLAVLKTQGAY